VAGAIPFGPAGGPFGPFVNRNHFAGWMLMVLPLVIGHACGTVARGTGRTGLDWRARLAWLSTREANQAVFAGCAILIMMLSLVMTLSRSGLVCLIVALLASALVVLRRSAKRWTTLVAVGCVMGLVVLTIGWAGMDAVANRFDQLRSDADGRILAWQDGWRVTSAFRWTGTGLNTYGIAMLFYQTFRVDTAHYAQAHNDYLQLLAEGGLLLLVPTLVLVTLFSREVFRRFRERRDDAYGYWVRCGAVTGLMTIAFQEVVDFSLQVPANAAMFALLCGIAARRPSGHVRPASTS
jgi:O-antigen ligase